MASKSAAYTLNTHNHEAVLG